MPVISASHSVPRCVDLRIGSILPLRAAARVIFVKLSRRERRNPLRVLRVVMRGWVTGFEPVPENRSVGTENLCTDNENVDQLRKLLAIEKSGKK